MSDDVVNALSQLDPPRRPWQLVVTGQGDAMPRGDTCRAIERILELFPCVGALVTHTVDGSFNVTRDFPSGYTEQVDQLLAGIFQSDPSVTGIAFPATAIRPGHTATLEDPHWSAEGKQGVSGPMEQKTGLGTIVG